MTDIQTIFMIFIAVLVGVVLIDSLGDAIFSANNPITVTQENVSFTTAKATTAAFQGYGSVFPNVTVGLANDDVLSIQTVELANGSTLTLNTDVVLNNSQAGTVHFLNSTLLYHTNNTNNILFNYTHAGDDFVQGSPVSNTLLGLILIFFALGIVGAALIGLKRSGIMDSFN